MARLSRAARGAQLNARGTAHFEVTDPQVLLAATHPAVREAAEWLRDQAANYTPVGEYGNRVAERNPGELKDGWRTEPVRPDRMLVKNDVYYGRWVEFGTYRSAPRAMLGRALIEARARYGAF